MHSTGKILPVESDTVVSAARLSLIENGIGESRRLQSSGRCSEHCVVWQVPSDVFCPAQLRIGHGSKERKGEKENSR